jgi:hypothetical protein
MKKLLFLIILLTSTLSLFGQDVITKTNGKKIYCKVIDVDSTHVYYNQNQDLFRYKIKRAEVREIQYGESFFDSSGASSGPVLNGARNSITIGVLEGGGSLIGFDMEFMVTKSAGIQFGAGIVGFGGSLNIHLKPTIRSTYISLQYWHQGYGDSYTQSLIGPSFVFRARKIFTAQIGFGFALETGPAWPSDVTQPPVELTYAIGVYFPF